MFSWWDGNMNDILLALHLDHVLFACGKAVSYVIDHVSKALPLWYCTEKNCWHLYRKRWSEGSFKSVNNIWTNGCASAKEVCALRVLLVYMCFNNASTCSRNKPFTTYWYSCSFVFVYCVTFLFLYIHLFDVNVEKLRVCDVCQIWTSLY